MRELTPSLVRMLWMWRATVCSLINNAAAIARFELPRAAKTSTSTSRSVNPPGRGAESVSSSCSTWAKSVAAADGPERQAGGVQLHRRRVRVAGLPEGDTDQQTHLRGLVGRSEVPPSRHALRSSANAPCGSPSANRTAPEAWAARARRHGISTSLAIALSSSARYARRPTRRRRA